MNKDNVTITRGFDKIKRNEMCPCDSGLKYKNCCLKKIYNQEQTVYENIHARKRAAEALAKGVKNGNSTNSSTDSPLILPSNLRGEKKQITVP